MQKLIKQAGREIIHGLILFVLVFSFIHSELGGCPGHCEGQNPHDFCRIVNGVTAQIARTTVASDFKPTADNDICLHCLTGLDPALAVVGNYIPGCSFHPNKTDRIYLHNSSFLI